jgi:ribosomal protein L30/L7E
VVEVLHALRLSRLNHATLTFVQRIVWLVIGQSGESALPHVEVAIELALDLSYSTQLREALHALKLSRFNHATLRIVKWIVWLVIGQIGDRARNHVEVGIELALDLS